MAIDEKHIALITESLFGKKGLSGKRKLNETTKSGGHSMQKAIRDAGKLIDAGHDIDKVRQHMARKGHSKQHTEAAIDYHMETPHAADMTK